MTANIKLLNEIKTNNFDVRQSECRKQQQL